MYYDGQMVPQETLHALIFMLRGAMEGHDNESQRKVYEQLTNLQENPISYFGLAVIAGNIENEISLRQIALLTLNSALKRNEDVIEFSSEQLHCLKSIILQMQNNSMESLKKCQKMLISKLCTWNRQIDYNILGQLLEKLQQVESQKWAIDIIYVIFEDIKFQTQNFHLIQNADFILFLSAFIGIFEQKIKSTDSYLISKLLGCMNFFMKYNQSHSQIRIHYFQAYLMPFLKIKDLPSCIILQLFDGITELIENGSTFVVQDEACIEALVSFQTHDIDVKKRWLSLMLDFFDADGEERLKKWLNVIVPFIIRCLIFTHQDQINVKLEMEEESNPYEYEQQTNEEYENLGEKTDGGYTLRRLGVMCIERIIMHYNEEIWGIIGPTIAATLGQNDLQTKKQREKQCGVLLMGLYFEKVEENLDFLEKVLPLVISLASNDKIISILQCTALWTLSKISYLIVRNPPTQSEVQKTLILVIMNETQKQANITNLKSLSQAKFTAYAALDELVSNSSELPQRTNEIVECIEKVIGQCNGKSLYSALKICSTLYERHSQSLQEQITILITKRLCEKWTEYCHNQSVMCPIIECLVTIASGHPNIFRSFGKQIFSQAVSLVMQNKNISHQKAILLRIIDLLSTLFGLKIVQLVQMVESNIEFHQKVIYPLIVNDDREVRHFGFGFIGDICKITSIPSFAPTYLSTISNHLDINNLTTCSNALLCMTDLILANASADWVRAFVSPVMALAIQKIGINNVHPVYAFNFARIYGRLSQQFPAQGWSFLEGNLQKVALALRSHETQKMTNEAYYGLFKMIELSKSWSLGGFEYLTEAYICYNSNDLQLDAFFHRILLNFKNGRRPEEWSKFLEKPNFLPAVVRKIQNLCI